METRTQTVTLQWDMVLFIVFLILKLTNVISWSWWIVTLPLWLPIVIFVLIMCTIGIFLVFTQIRKKL